MAFPRGESHHAALVFRAKRSVAFAPRRVRFRGQGSQELKKLRRLTDEKPVVGKRLDRSPGRPPRLGRTNDRTRGELPAQKHSWLGHDQVGLEVFASKRGSVQVGERHTHTCHGIDHVGQDHGVARLVVPRLEVTDLGAADAEQYAQCFDAVGALGELRIEARPALFDKGEMEAGGVGDGLDEIGVGCVGIRSRNGGVPATCKRRDRRSEGIPEIGVSWFGCGNASTMSCRR